MKGLVVSVYRAEWGDTTNGGASSRYERMILVGDEVNCDVFEGREDNDNVLVFVRDICAGRERIRAIPYNLYNSGKWVMMGGNFVYSSDSRFPSDQPVAIFDRVEV